MKVEIEVSALTAQMGEDKKNHLQVIAQNIELGNLKFLAELASKKGINQKLNSSANRLLIKSYL